MAIRQNLSCKSIFTRHFSAMIIIIILTYLLYNLEFMFSQVRPVNLWQSIVSLIFFNIFFCLMLWALGMSMLTNPGPVPAYWGFFKDMQIESQKRYCILCHAFKPPRTHHCSTCQQCVLNMDHHCPWISNCVGFHNRKYFMLFLFYMILAIIVSLMTCLPLLIIQLVRIGQGSNSFTKHTAFRIFGLLFQMFVLLVVALFFKFHFNMILSNTTTLENMMRKRDSKINHQMPLSISPGEPGNSSQSPALNPIPIAIPAAQPLIPNSSYLSPQLSPYPPHMQQPGPQNAVSPIASLGYNPRLSNLYDLGKYANFTQVFGESSITWLLPFGFCNNLKGDGVLWPRIYPSGF